jgi:hypothetical protein
MDQVLYSQLQKLVSTDGYSVSDFMDILEPIDLYTNNPAFDSGIQSIVTAVVKDRDGDSKFTVNDLKVLSTDIPAMTSLISSLILTLSSVPELHIKDLSEQDAAEILFKTLVYVFLVVVPKQTGVKFTSEERSALLDLCVVIWNLALSSKAVKNILKFIKKQTAKLCACLRVQFNPSEEISAKSVELASHAEKARYISTLEERIRVLENS